MTISEWAPTTVHRLFGDFRHCWIADALSMHLQRLNKLYAETTHQIGFNY